MNLNRVAEDTRIVHLIEEFRAPRDRVFKVWTEPGLLRKWFMAEDGWTVTAAEVDLQVGGAYHLSVSPGEGDSDMAIDGVFRVVQNPDYLEYTWLVAVLKGRETLVQVRFIELESGSKIDLSHGVFESAEERQLHLDGWTGCMRRLHILLQS